MTNNKGRRYKKVLISGWFLAEQAIEGSEHNFKTIKGLPSGTKFAYAIPSDTYGIWIVVEHDSFPEVQDGTIIPEFYNVEFMRIDK